MTGPAPAAGLLEWFVVGEHERAERVLEEVRALGASHVRTGLSWADWHAPGGREWYDWLLPRLAEDSEVLPCISYTPPSLGVIPTAAAPPRQPRDYADLVDELLTRYGRLFPYVELWNEPNNLSDWDWKLDPGWSAFAATIAPAAHWARRRGHRVVLGGMSPLDANWVALMGELEVLDHVDVVGIHGFPGTWEVDWEGWPESVAAVENVLARYDSPAEVWVTETGFSTWRHDERGQVDAFAAALSAPVARVYWYAVEDLGPSRATADGLHADERDYHLGVYRADGTPKLLARLWRERGTDALRRASPPAVAPAAGT